MAMRDITELMNAIESVRETFGTFISPGART